MNITELKEAVEKYLTEKKPMMLSQIAAEFEISSLQAAEALPSNMVSFAPSDAFETIWKELTTWKKSTFIIQYLGSVFEVCGKLNQGSFGRGYFNLNGDEALHGHLNVEDISRIAFVSMPFMGLESHNVLFFNAEGIVKFSVYVGREEKILIPEAKESFLTMQKEYTEK